MDVDPMDQAFLYFATLLLVFARVVGFFVQTPIYGSNHINDKVLVGLSVCMTLIIYPNIPLPQALPGGPVILFLLIFTQVVVGLVMGYVSFLVMAAAQFGGEMLDIQMGLSSAAASDPSSKGTINLIRRLKFYIAMIFYMMINGHHALIESLARSFDIIPLTGFKFSPALNMELIRLTGQVFYIGVQIGLPVMGALFMVQIALGVMAKVAPQMNVFMLSFPLNILVGLSMLVTALPIFIKVLEGLFVRSNEWVLTVLQLMAERQ